MFGRNVFAIAALVLFAVVLSASALPQEMTDVEVEEYGLVKDFVDYLKDNMKIAKQCVDEALKVCKAELKTVFKIPVCMTKYILQKHGLCNIHNL